MRALPATNLLWTPALTRCVTFYSRNVWTPWLWLLAAGLMTGTRTIQTLAAISAHPMAGSVITHLALVVVVVATTVSGTAVLTGAVRIFPHVFAVAASTLLSTAGFYGLTSALTCTLWRCMLARSLSH